MSTSLSDAAWIVRQVVGGYEARQHTMNPTGGDWIGEAVRADTLAELRGLLPAGLERQDSVIPEGVVEIWWAAAELA